MALDVPAYAHITAHTVHVLDQFMAQLREHIAKHPRDADYYRTLHYGRACGAQDLWIAATLGMSSPEDAATINEKVRAIYEVAK